MKILDVEVTEINLPDSTQFSFELFGQKLAKEIPGKMTLERKNYALNCARLTIEKIKKEKI